MVQMDGEVHLDNLMNATRNEGRKSFMKYYEKKKYFFLFNKEKSNQQQIKH